MDADVVVIGAGAIGTSTALHLAQAGHRVVVLEKEEGPAQHQSSRNSGVIHAGYNLKPGSDKARFCVEGSRRLKAYCAERGVAVRPGGILVVARTEEERAVLGELKRRADANGVEARLVDGAGVTDLEPEARGVAALHAPGGASFDALGYVRALAADAAAAGAGFRYSTSVRELAEAGPPGVTLRTDRGPVRARVAVNCAGLQSDRIAGSVAHDLRVIPFRGFYAELRPERTGLVRSHIYAAPDLAFPFLGVHLSCRFDGRVIVGPGAMLAFGREAYTFWRVQPRDLAATLSWPGTWRLLADPRVRRLVRSETAKSLRLSAIAREARLLVPSLRPGDLVRSYAGNRAQVVDRKGRLVEDIVVRKTERCVHVLNAVSPGLTGSLPFGEHLAREAAKLI